MPKILVWPHRSKIGEINRLEWTSVWVAECRPRRLPRAVGQSCRSTAIAPRLKSTNGSSDRSTSSASRILQSRWSFRSRSAGSVLPVCRTVTSVHRIGTSSRRKAGKICSCTAYVHRTSSRTEFPTSFRLASMMTEDHRPEPGIDHGVPGMRRSDKAESPVLRSPTSCDISDVPFSLPQSRRLPDDQLRPRDDLTQIGAHGDCRDCRLDPGVLQSAQRRQPFQVGPDAGECVFQSVIAQVAKSNLVPCQGKLLGDAMAHQSGTDDRNALDPRMIHAVPFAPGDDAPNAHRGGGNLLHRQARDEPGDGRMILSCESHLTF